MIKRHSEYDLPILIQGDILPKILSRNSSADLKPSKSASIAVISKGKRT